MRTYEISKCPEWLSIVLVDWVSPKNIDSKTPIHIVDVAAHVVTRMRIEHLRSVFLDDDKQETDRTFESMAALAELAEHLRLLGVGGDAESVTLCELILSQIEDDLDWLDRREAVAMMVGEARSVLDWSKIDPRSLWSTAAWPVAGSMPWAVGA